MKYSKTEEQWLASPNGKKVGCEPLNDMIMLKKISLLGKPHILALVFSTHSLWLSFKAHTSLITWMEKLSLITSKDIWHSQSNYHTNHEGWGLLAPNYHP